MPWKSPRFTLIEESVRGDRIEGVRLCGNSRARTLEIAATG
jgi:hypothetical protein